MRKLEDLSSYLRPCRALEFRSEAAQHCSADVQQRLMGRMRNLVEGDLCPAVPAAPAVEDQTGSTIDDIHSGTTGSTAFRNASASLAVAIFMADLVAQVWTVVVATTEASGCTTMIDTANFRLPTATCRVQVEGHCAERGWALARLWNAHIAIAAQTARAPLATHIP